MLRAGLLLVAVIIFPFGFAVAQDYEAVGKRLAKAVVKGELTWEQANAMMESLHEQEQEFWDIGKELRDVGDELKAAVARGEMTEDEAWHEWYQFKEEEVAPRLKEAVEEGEMSEAEAWGIWKGIEKGEKAEQLKAAVMKGEMSEEEARREWEKMGRDERPHPHRDAIDRKRAQSDEAVRKRIKAALKKAGFSEEQMKQAHGGLMRLVHQMKNEGDDYEMDRRLRDYFSDKVGLNEEQIGLLDRIARRLAHRASHPHGENHSDARRSGGG
jgi:polyhydroxyalkanoate synthesis regulator phasin